CGLSAVRPTLASLPRLYLSSFTADSLSLYLFVSPYGDRRYLHSFPTRRSSDLLLVRITAQPHFDRNIFFPIFSAQLFHLVKLLKDRKSTRLNSSHVSISYAVFCLKKKKFTAGIR